MMDNNTQKRLDLINQWLASNGDLLVKTEAVRILIHIKGTSVKGEITSLPDTK